MRCTVFNRKSLLFLVSFAVILVSMNAAWAGIGTSPFFEEISGEVKVKSDLNEVVRMESETEFIAVAGGFQAEGEIELFNEATLEKAEISWVAVAGTRVRAYAGVVEVLHNVFMGPNPPGFIPTLVTVNSEGNLLLSMNEVAEVGTWLALFALPVTGNLLPEFTAVGDQLGITINCPNTELPVPQ